MVVSLPINSYAADSVAIKEGEKAPFTGVLLTNDKANEIRESLESLKRINESLERSIVLYKQNEDLNNQRVNVLLEHNKKLIDNSVSAEYKTWAIILISVAATLGAVYAGKKVTE